MTSEKFKVIVVGSGLAGLAAARFVRAHHHVTVYERNSSAISTSGQGISISPGSVKLLESVGFQKERAHAVPIHGMVTYVKGEVTGDLDFDNKSRFGASTLSMKRSDFREELMRLVSEDLENGEAVKMIFDKQVTGIDCNEGIVELSDGTTDFSDVIIVADGIHSRLRNAVVQSEAYAPRKRGLTCYRVAVSVEDAKKALGNLPLPLWLDSSTGRNVQSLVYTSNDSPRFILTYPIRDRTMFNISCLLRTDSSTKTELESWDINGDKEKMLEAFSDFGEAARRILRFNCATEIKVWELQDLSTLPTWVHGRTMLIGDAAHAMTPMQGQGANMGIEDAEALRLLGPNVNREGVFEVLDKIAKMRMKRVDRILEETRKAHSTKEIAEKLRTNAELYYGYQGIFATSRLDEDDV